MEEKKQKDMFLFSQNTGVVTQEEVEELDHKITEMRAQVEALKKERYVVPQAIYPLFECEILLHVDSECTDIFLAPLR